MSCKRLVATVLASMILPRTGAAQPAERAPPSPTRGHQEAHGEVGLGLGLLTAGVGLEVGYRTSFGARFEAALGTLGVASGGSLGAGFSFRVYDDSTFTAEVPLMVYAVGATVDPLEIEYECEGSGCNDRSSHWLTAVGGALGVDLIFGTSRTNRGRFVLGLRGGRAVVFAGAESEHWPLAQSDFAVTF